MPKKNEKATVGGKSKLHEKFIKQVFQNLKYVAGMCRFVMSLRFHAMFKWDTLSAEPQLLLVSEVLHERFADSIYTVMTRCGRRVVLLFEHKSRRDGSLAQQLADYQFMYYQQHGCGSPVLPIVVQQESSGKVEPVRFSDLFEDFSDEELEALDEFVIGFKSLMIHVDEIDRQGLARGTELDAVFHAMSTVRGFRKESLPELLARVRHVPAEDRGWMAGLVFGYICRYNDHITAEDVRNLTTETSEEKEMVQTAVDEFIQEGLEQGLEQGLAKGQEIGLAKGREMVASNLLQEGMEPDRVARVTDLSQQQVEELRQKINGAP